MDKHQFKPQNSNRQQRSFVIHNFRGSTTTAKKNVSYIKYEPKLEDIEHKHFFHTKDQRGRDMAKCSELAGHWHNMTWELKEGQLVAKCGPPMRMVTTRLKSGKKSTQPQQVRFELEDGQFVNDDHIHNWEYMGYDEIDLSIAPQVREARQAEMLNQGANVDTQVKPMGQAAPITAADGVEIREG
jgi:hypothetical protein